MRPLGAGLAEAVERSATVDDLSARLQAVARKILPEDGRIREALAGTWLGHPLHPLLTDVVIGAWTSAWLLDVAGGRRSRVAADRLVALGAVAAVPTVAAGLADWVDLPPRARRLGLVHAGGNVTAVALQLASWSARRSGRRGLGIGLSSLGAVVASGAGWLGGRLTYTHASGVNETAFTELPEDWTTVEGDVPGEGELRRAVANGLAVLLVTHDGRTRAMLDRCSHRGCSLAAGRLEDDLVVCACHGSAFSLDGAVRRGPAVAPQPGLETRLRGGRVEVRAARDAGAA